MQAYPTWAPWSPSPIELDPARRRDLASCVIDVDVALRRHVLSSTQRTTLSELRSTLQQVLADAAHLDRDGVSVVFIAPKGAGKSSLLNGILNLWTALIGQPEPGESLGEHLQRLSALPLGAGGTTPCEVQFRHAGSWSIQVEREDDATVLARVRRLAESTWQRTMSGTPAEAPGLAGAPATATVEQDVDRCLTGVCGHTPESLAALAKTLASHPLGLAQLHDALIRQINHASKTSLHIQPSKDELPVDWLRRTLLALTWGRHPGQPFPVRIVVHGPALPRMQGSTQALRLVDTLGLTAGAVGAETPARAVASLEARARDPWAVVLFVAAYMNPPEPVTDSLKYLFSCANPRMEADRTIVPVLYKGEAITLDPNTREPKQAQRGQDAYAKQEVSIAGINQLLRQANRPPTWTRDQSPVVDLLGMLGPAHGTHTLTSALDSRLQRLRDGWHARAEQAVRETRHFLETYDTIVRVGISRTDFAWLGNGQAPITARARFRERLKAMVIVVSEWLLHMSGQRDSITTPEVRDGGGKYWTCVLHVKACSARLELKFSMDATGIVGTFSTLPAGTRNRKELRFMLPVDSKGEVYLSKLEFVHRWSSAAYI